MRKQMRSRIIIALALAIGMPALLYVLSFANYNENSVQMIMQIAILLAFALFIYRNRNKPVNYNEAVVLLLFIGFVMRIGYTAYTPGSVRAHDLGPITVNSNGNASYILNFYLNHSLPAGNTFQFSHPPLFPALAALTMVASRNISGIQDPVLLLESARLVSCAASCATLIIAYKIAQSLKLKRKALLVFIGVTALLPNHYLLAGRINNDALSVFFMYGIILCAIRWYHEPKQSNIVWLAFMFGFGLMTKFSVAVLSVPVGILMIYRVYKTSKKNGFKRLIIQLVVFLSISLPLGLWFYIRNWLLFQQPLGAVHVFEGELYNLLYIGDQSFWARFGLPSIQAFFQGGGLAETATGNVWLYMAKCPVFGEFSYNICDVCKTLMVAAHAAIILLAIIAIIYTAIDSIRKWNIIWIFVLLTGLSVITAYFVFIVRYPFFCSLDFRYIVPVSLCGALCIGNLYNKADGTDRKFALYCDAVNISIILFAVTSIVMYTNLPS